MFGKNLRYKMQVGEKSEMSQFFSNISLSVLVSATHYISHLKLWENFPQQFQVTYIVCSKIVIDNRPLSTPLGNKLYIKVT